MDWKLYRDIIDQYRRIGGECVTFCQHNDTFAHASAVEYIKYAHASGLNIYIVTNAFGLTPEVVDHLAGFGFSGSLYLSIHGIDVDTYRKTTGLELPIILQNAEYARAKLPIAGVRALSHNFREGEAERVARYWADRNIKVFVEKPHDWAGTLKTGITPGPIHLQVLRGCHIPLNQMCVGYSGIVYLCCHDILKKTVLGDLKTESIEQVWDGEKMQEFMEYIFKMRTPPDDFICLSCHVSAARNPEYAA